MPEFNLIPRNRSDQRKSGVVKMVHERISFTFSIHQTTSNLSLHRSKWQQPENRHKEPAYHTPHMKHDDDVTNNGDGGRAHQRQSRCAPIATGVVSQAYGCMPLLMNLFYF